MFLQSQHFVAVAAATAVLSAYSGAAMAQSATLEQCANGPAAAPVGCSGSAWVNGRLNPKSSHYAENQVVPLRVRFEKLIVGQSATLTFRWDTTEGGLHTYDYLASFDATESIGNNPCSGVSPCVLNSSFPVPLDPNVRAAGAAQSPGLFWMSGGTITSVSAYTVDGSYADGSSTAVTISFVPAQSNPVLAFGAHIAARPSWTNVAAGTSTAYHINLVRLSGKRTGGEERTLSGVTAAGF